jgi:iron-sulfur cluster assembly accessory protein
MTEATQTTPIVVLTENAANEIKSMQANNPENQGKLLRVYVEKGGCSGLQYGLTFDEERPGDVRAEFHGASVLIDSFSAQFLKGAKVDFVDALTGGGFKVLNPNARQSCGCGNSFET